MVLNNNKMMLIFGFEEEDITFLDNIIKELNLPNYKIIKENMANMKLRDIIDGPLLDTYNKELPNEQLIIFNNFSDYELDMTIRTIRSNKNIKPILAVATPTSLNWEFHYLLEHLMEEREQARRYMQHKTQG
jgi:hypothetical protein